MRRASKVVKDRAFGPPRDEFGNILLGREVPLSERKAKAENTIGALTKPGGIQARDRAYNRRSSSEPEGEDTGDIAGGTGTENDGKGTVDGLKQDLSTKFEAADDGSEASI